MKHMAEMLLKEEAFSEIVMGNTALVRSMVEAGTRVVTSYPGSPTPEIAEAIASIPFKKRPFYFEFSTNEKVATEIAYGAGINGHLSTVFFKSVGLNVAADTFVQLSLMNIIGGMVIVLGDDPGANSSQNEQDNRHIAMMSYTPVLEPASPDEVYRFYRLAARLSQEKAMPIVLRLTTHVCHAKERVSFDSWQPVELDRSARFDPSKGPYIPIASEVFPMKRRAIARISEIGNWADEEAAIHINVDNKNSERGVITAGLPFLSLMDVFNMHGKKPDVLKLGMVFPLPRQTISAFLRSHKEVKILEELDPIMEIAIKSIAFEEAIAVKIIGKTDSEQWIGEYTPDKVDSIMKGLWPDMFSPVENEKEKDNQNPIAARPAQMCPGCGHRSAFYAIKKALQKQDITVADIGCHTLGFLPPYRMGEALMSMGASTGIASGLSLFNAERKVVAFLGDSTFFHAGIPGIINAIFNNHRLTLILMENGTTAMTGHQDHAGSGRNFNEPTNAISIRKFLESLGIKHVFEIDTYKQSELTDLVKKAVSIDEFSVVIARHPCMLKFTREQRRKSGFISKRVGIDQNICQQLHECVQRFGCPTFFRHENGKVCIHPDLCIGDGSCVQTCPAGAIQKPAEIAAIQPE